MTNISSQSGLLNAANLPLIAKDIEKPWGESDDAELAPAAPSVPDWVGDDSDIDAKGHFDDQPVFDEDDERDATVGVAQSGVEAIAFYKSFRYAHKAPFNGKWGVFIFRKRFNVLAGQLSRLAREPMGDVVKVLMRFLLGHERYHYQLDVLLLHCEAMTRQPLYRPYMHIYRQGARGTSGDLWEEALANMKGLDVLSPSYIGTRNRLRSEFEEFVEGSPGAYALGLQRTRKKEFEANLVAQLLQYPRRSAATANRHAIDLMESQLIHFVGGEYRPPLTPASCDGPYWVGNGKHLDHAAIAIKRREFRDGFVRGYLSGCLTKKTDHEFFEIDNRQTVKMPNDHGSDIRHDELNNVIKKAGFKNERQFELKRQETRIWTRESPRPEPVAPIASFGLD
jgi:hypothetical protein